MKTLADKILDFLFHLQLPFKLPKNVGVMDAHKDLKIQSACIAFYKKFYSDNNPRHLMLGTNPGRFGGGVTGIPFTDPIRLENVCGIKNEFVKKQELSSVFIYSMIEAYGGVEKFYGQFYISATSPLGFIRDGRNLNYYDDKTIKQLIEPFVIDCINRQLSWGLYHDICFCIGEGENLKYLQQLNSKHEWFKQIKPISHPRFIMQYKLKQKDIYIQQYIDALSSVHRTTII
jgi:Uracil DNA glycosylase superfamily